MEGLFLGGVEVSILVIGVTEALKGFVNFSGNQSKAVAFVTALIFFGLALAVNDGVFSENVVKYIELVVRTLAYSLAAMGYYQLATRSFLGPRE